MSSMENVNWGKYGTEQSWLEAIQRKDKDASFVYCKN
jgi:hypothetical protein